MTYLHPLGKWLLPLVLASLTGCASTLAGKWDVHWPDGRKDTAVLQDFGNGKWYLRSNTAELNGVYLFEHATLTSIDPELPRMAGFVWNRDSTNSFTLIAQPQPTRLHDHWLGTQLVRDRAH